MKLNDDDLKAAKEAFELLDNAYPFLPHQEGDYWCEDPDNDSVVLLCQKNGAVRLMMSKEDYESIKVWDDKQSVK